MRTALVETLRAEGYRVLGAADGPAGLELACTEAFDFLDVVWGYHAYPSTRTVDNFITGLRAKLEDDPTHPRHLVTVRGVGYRLEF